MNKKPRSISLNCLANYYDYFTFTEKSQFRKNQIDLMDIRKGEKVLDVGCGTGVLSILSKNKVGNEGVVAGIDIAPRMIHRAQNKALNACLKIHYQVASVSQLPFPDQYFDLVISSLMFHHLPTDLKKAALLEIYRVMNKQGRFFLCDFGSPRISMIPLMYLMLVWISPTRYQLLGRLPNLIRECGFKSIRLVKKGVFLEYYLITKISN